MKTTKTEINKISEDCLNQIKTLQVKENDLKLELESCIIEFSALNEQIRELGDEKVGLTEAFLEHTNRLEDIHKYFKLQLENCSKEVSILNEQRAVLEIENSVLICELEILKRECQINKSEDLQGTNTQLKKMSEVCINNINMLQDKQNCLKQQLENCSKEVANLNEQKKVLEIENSVLNSELEILKRECQMSNVNKQENTQMQVEAVSRRRHHKEKKNDSMVQVVPRETPVISHLGLFCKQTSYSGPRQIQIQEMSFSQSCHIQTHPGPHHQAHEISFQESGNLMLLFCPS